MWCKHLSKLWMKGKMCIDTAGDILLFVCISYRYHDLISIWFPKCVGVCFVRSDKDQSLQCYSRVYRQTVNTQFSPFTARMLCSLHQPSEVFQEGNGNRFNESFSCRRQPGSGSRWQLWRDFRSDDFRSRDPVAAGVSAMHANGGQRSVTIRAPTCRRSQISVSSNEKSLEFHNGTHTHISIA